MSNPSGPWQMWTRRLLAIFTLHKLRDTKNNWCENGDPCFPECHQGNKCCQWDDRSHYTAATDETTLRRLERDIRLLAEVLEPLGYTESYLFSPELLHQLRRLGSYRTFRRG
ncbi:hypothetical protein BS47DRAFT_792109 [Hydnum rufescens UP504]|uniref:Uncharacterized protein n=1 Tax=Hydnum rufescens UP504 TaxID=1448309 RepID=A0A9P6DY57_9AGAM|nr:hypothetical protein BS47DRAFT_792109 [Hydnum rufescens UP504]